MVAIALSLVTTAVKSWSERGKLGHLGERFRHRMPWLTGAEQIRSSRFMVAPSVCILKRGARGMAVADTDAQQD